MAEGRFISRSIATNGQLKRVSLEADYLFGRMIPHLDRDGRMGGDPDVVKALACPLRGELTPELIATCLAELDATDLVVWYEVDSEKVLWFPGFREHQKGIKLDRERASRLPSHEAQGAKKVRHNAGVGPDPVRSRSAQVKLREVKSSEDSAGGGSWVAEGVDIWASVAPIGHGRLGKALKAVVVAHGWHETRDGLRAYIELSEGKARKVEWFADDAVRWIRIGKMPSIDPDTGAFTERGEMARRAALRLA